MRTQHPEHTQDAECAGAQTCGVAKLSSVDFAVGLAPERFVQFGGTLAQPPLAGSSDANAATNGASSFSRPSAAMPVKKASTQQSLMLVALAFSQSQRGRGGASHLATAPPDAAGLHSDWGHTMS